MKTNFFELVAGLSVSGNLQINIHPNESGTQTVSVLLTAKDPKLTTGKNLPPMLLTGSPQELGDAFFQLIGQPVTQTEKLFSNAEAYQIELDKAKKLAAGNKDKKSTGAATPTEKGNDNNLFNVPPQQPEEDDDELENQANEGANDGTLLAEKAERYVQAMQMVNTLNGQMKYAEAIAQLPDPKEYPEKADEIKDKGDALLKRQELYASLQQEV